MLSARFALNGNRTVVQYRSVVKNRLVSYAKSAKEEQAAFWQKNAKLNRPISPHLTIYRLPLTANMSIMHRATGNALSGVVILAGLGSLYGAGSFDKFFQFLQENIHPHVMLTFKFLIALPLVYHTLAGIRHLTWDTGKGLKLPVLYKTGYSLIALTFLASFALASIH